jgi:hypothetical protein
MHARTAVTLALLAAACDREPEWNHLAQVRVICADLEARHAGAADAESLLGPVTWTSCGVGYPPASETDLCPREGTVCIRVWAFRARNEGLCGGPGCSYGCELRAPEADAEATCSVRFLGGRERPPPPPP